MPEALFPEAFFFFAWCYEHIQNSKIKTILSGTPFYSLLLESFQNKTLSEMFNGIPFFKEN